MTENFQLRTASAGHNSLVVQLLDRRIHQEGVRAQVRESIAGSGDSVPADFLPDAVAVRFFQEDGADHKPHGGHGEDELWSNHI